MKIKKWEIIWAAALGMTWLMLTLGVVFNNVVIAILAVPFVVISANVAYRNENLKKSRTGITTKLAVLYYILTIVWLFILMAIISRG